jgi:threonine/homoserine/homoserine lactone efflux protein
METIFFLKGLLVGFAMAIPIGPVGVLCIRQTLAEGHSRGLVIGLGAASVDALYSSIGAFGLTFVSDMIANQYVWVRLIGGGLLAFLGIRTLLTSHKHTTVPFEGKGPLGSYVTAFLLALTNPVTVFAFVAVFAAIGLGHGLSMMSASILVLGVVIGSTLWFLTLGGVARFFRERLDTGGLKRVNAIAGGFLIVSALAAFVSVL